MSVISQEVLSGLILTAIVWSGGIVVQWLRSRGSELSAIRKYERLRAKVEVLSRLVNVKLDDEIDHELNQRQQLLVRNELRAVLDELEREDRTTQNKQVRLKDLLGVFWIGPSYGTWAIVTKVVYYLSNFVFLWLLTIFGLVLYGPESEEIATEADRHNLLVGTVCILAPFLMNSIGWFWLAKRSHRQTPTVEAEILPISDGLLPEPLENAA